jgi:hypothetical protein
MARRIMMSEDPNSDAMSGFLTALAGVAAHHGALYLQQHGSRGLNSRGFDAILSKI